jgi:hypothetical protein
VVTGSLVAELVLMVGRIVGIGRSRPPFAIMAVERIPS